MRPTPYDGPALPAGPSRKFILRAVVLIVLLIGLFQSTTIYVESLWFGSLGFGSVYWYQLKAQSLAFGAFFSATTIILWLMFWLVVPSSRGPRRPLLMVNGNPVYLPGLDTVRRLVRPVATLAGIFFGLVFSPQWM